MKTTSNGIGMHPKGRQGIFIGIFILLAVTISSCHRKDGVDRSPVFVVKLNNYTSLGSYLTDNSGRTLYYFANDSASVNSCSGGCAKVWPIFHTDSLTSQFIGDGLSLSDFGEITISGGIKQNTYKGRPLYYYAPSNGGTNKLEAPGHTSGEGVGGVWFVAKPDYTIMLTRAQLVGNNSKNYIFDTAGTPSPTYSEGNGKSIYFTDAKGVTLYIFKPDKFNTNTFTKPDFSNDPVWPLYQMDKIVVPSVLDKSLFGVITVFGKKQMTYKGWPLYYFGQDAMTMGATKGVSFPAAGVWPVATRGLMTAPNP